MQIVPQFIDTEDKVAGPFTWKQLSWLALGGFILYILWKVMDLSGFLVLGIPVVLIIASFAFYKPNGDTFAKFLIYAITYFFKPHVYTWQRQVQKDLPAKDPKTAEHRIQKKALTEDDILTLTEAVDSRGAIRNERLDELIKQNLKKAQKK